MCHDAFPWHQEGARKVICVLFSLYSRKIATLTMQDKMPQLMGSIESTPFCSLHCIQEDKRYAIIVDRDGVALSVLRSEGKNSDSMGL
jgi:hypothetical protein